MAQSTGQFNTPQGAGGDLLPKVTGITSALFGANTTQLIRASALELNKQTNTGIGDYTGFYAVDTTPRQVMTLVKPCHIGIMVQNLDKLVNNTSNPVYCCTRSTFNISDSDVFRIYPSDAPFLLPIADGSVLYFKTATGTVPFQWFGS